MHNLSLRPLAWNDEQAFMAGTGEWAGEDFAWYSFDWKPGMPFPELLERLRKNTAGEDLPPDTVPSTMLYGFVDGEIVGRVHIRHYLNDRLRRFSGHIGYAVAPRFRRKGYASEMVGQALPFCAVLGISDMLVMADDNNIASIKIIEKYGGVLENVVMDGDTPVRRYWIRL